MNPQPENATEESEMYTKKNLVEFIWWRKISPIRKLENSVNMEKHHKEGWIIDVFNLLYTCKLKPWTNILTVISIYDKHPIEQERT